MRLPSSNFINKKSVVLLVVAIGLSLPMASWGLSYVVQLLGELIFKLIMSPFYLLLRIEVWLLVILAKYNSFIHEKGVVIGWTAMRDLSNMFFILILLIISFATIIRTQGYGYKQTLSRLIIVAILINFSRLIVGLLIDFSQIIMLTFVQAFQDVAAGNLIVALGLGEVNGAGDNPLNDASYIQALFLGAAMLVLAVVVIGAFIAILAARAVKLWILIIMSPLAFLSYVLPKTQGFFNKWVSDLGKNLFSGPTLAFFLWLTFIITGRGDISTGFLNGETVDQNAAINEVSKAASPQNVINYIIAIAMLAGSLQIVGASGAAGASIASKASQGVNNYAAKLGRRYPLAMASRAGTLASRGLVDSDGNARRLFGGNKWYGKWDKIPFMGGRIQRTAHKMQGYDAARIKKEQEEDTKYIKPTQLGAFYGSQQTASNLLGIKSKKLATLYSTISSQGGNFDKDANLAQMKTDRGDYDTEDIPKIASHLRRIGDEKRLTSLQNKYPTAYANDEEIKRRINAVGIPGVVKDLEPTGLGDENFNPSEETERLIKVLLEHDDTDGPELRSLILKLKKRGRATATKAIANLQNSDTFQKSKGNGIFSTDSEGYMQFDQKNSPVFNNTNPAMKSFVATSGVYPNLAVGMLKELLASIDFSKLRIRERDILGHLEPQPDESKEAFKEREATAKRNISAARDLDRGSFTSDEKYDAERNRLLLAAAGIGPIESLRTYSSLEEWKTKNNPAANGGAFKNINLEGLKKQDKESQESFVSRVNQAVAHNLSAEQRYEEEVVEKESRIRDVQTKERPGLSAEEKTKVIDREIAEILDDPGLIVDNLKRGLVVEAADGMDFSRWHEMDLSDPEQAQFARELAKVSTTAQQAQAFNADTRAQNEILAQFLAEAGRSIPKIIGDNIGDDAKAKIKQMSGDRIASYSGGGSSIGPSEDLLKALRVLAQTDRELANKLSHLGLNNLVEKISGPAKGEKGDDGVSKKKLFKEGSALDEGEVVDDSKKK